MDFIPVDVSTDLIKATGKKIVATKIPELEAYKEHFAYLENNVEKFCDAVGACQNGTDMFAPVADCFTFAQDNDWDVRAQVFEREVMVVYRNELAKDVFIYLWQCFLQKAGRREVYGASWEKQKIF